MNWYEHEKQGWSWASGWNARHGSYYAQAWRDFPQPVVLDGSRLHCECVTQFGKSLLEAEERVKQRIEQL